MAKNITLMGANYPDVPAVQLPQTGGGVATFYDIDHIGDTYSNNAYADGAGTIAIQVPAGTYVICYGGTALGGNTYLDARIDPQPNYASMGTFIMRSPDNPNAQIMSYDKTAIKTYSAATTITMTYGTDWYWVHVDAVRIA